MPSPGGYWLWPSRIAATAASITAAGPSVSGKPCPRLTAPVRTASADISAKIVVPKPRRREASAGRSRAVAMAGSLVTVVPPLPPSRLAGVVLSPLLKRLSWVGLPLGAQGRTAPVKAFGWARLRGGQRAFAVKCPG